MQNIKDTIKEIKKDAEKMAGWDDCNIYGIEKFGTELCVKTSRGELFLSVRKFMEQYEFRISVAEEFGIFLSPVNKKIYPKWLEKWFSIIRDLRAEDGDLIDTVFKRLEEYAGQADEEDAQYIEMGRPIVLSEQEIAFKADNFLLWLKKTHDTHITTDQLYFILRKNGCQSKRLGKKRIRVWIYTRPKEEESQEKLLE